MGERREVEAKMEEFWSENSAAEVEECGYCGATVPHRESVPGKHDDEAWDELRDEHYATCEWTATRAHRLEP